MTPPKYGPQEEPAHLLYDRYPDYTRPMLWIPPEDEADLHSHLEFLYGKDAADKWITELIRRILVHHAHKPPELVAREQEYDPRERFTEKDMVLITYGDMVRSSDEGPPLAQLAAVCERHMEAVNTIHILPFFPYSSDRGFSIIDFDRVDPRLGDWENIRDMAGHFELMFDGVLNHASSRSPDFQEFLNGNPEFQDHFVAYDSPDDLTEDQRSKIFRPRTSDILTPFATLHGPKYVWTTFSADQIDFNFRNPEVLLNVVDTLLLYIRKGADIVRLDAVTYVWSEPGTECVHLPETHEIVKLMRTVVDLAAPGAALITETNVPHEDNVSYFGNGKDEAHMVYNFALPPMVLYTLYTQDASALSAWAAGLEEPSNQATFFNMLDTHDGIGLMGVKGILSQAEKQKIIQGAQANGALISYKAVEGGQEEPYEINTTWWSALNGDDDDKDLRIKVRRLAASRAISLMIQGVPAIYIHGGIGSNNDWETYERTQHRRDVNRAPVYMHELRAELEDSTSKASLIRDILKPLNKLRVTQKAFHPHAPQKVLNLSPSIFALLRTTRDGGEHILALVNVTPKQMLLEISLADLGLEAELWRDLVSNKEFIAKSGALALDLDSYQVAWLRPLEEMD